MSGKEETLREFVRQTLIHPEWNTKWLNDEGWRFSTSGWIRMSLDKPEPTCKGCSCIGRGDKPCNHDALLCDHYR